MIATVDGRLHEFSPSFEHRRHLWTTPDGATPESLSCDVAGEWVALVTEQGDVFVGRLAADGTGEWRRLGLNATTVEIDVAKSGHRLAVRTDATFVQVWTLALPCEKVRTASVPAGLESIALTQDASHLLCLTNHGDCGLLPLPDGGWEAITSDFEGIVGVAVDHDGMLILFRGDA